MTTTRDDIFMGVFDWTATGSVRCWDPVSDIVGPRQGYPCLGRDWLCFRIPPGTRSGSPAGILEELRCFNDDAGC